MPYRVVRIVVDYKSGVIRGTIYIMSRNKKKVAQADVPKLLFQKESWGGYSAFRSCPITLEDVTCRSKGVSWARRKAGLIIRKRKGEILCISVKCIKRSYLEGIAQLFCFL